jgi:hypothetical protein
MVAPWRASDDTSGEHPQSGSRQTRHSIVRAWTLSPSNVAAAVVSMRFASIAVAARAARAAASASGELRLLNVINVDIS